VNLIVNATPTVQHRETAEVVVRGQSLGFPDELAALRLTLVASVPPGPSRQTLYFHAAQGEDAGTLDALCIIFFCFDRQATWSNTLQEDSLANLDDGFHMDMMGFGFGNVAYSARFPLDTPLAQAVVLDANKSIEAELVFKPVVEFSGSVSLEVTTSMSGRLIAGGSYSGTIGTAVIPLSFLPLADAVRVTPEDGRLELRLTVRTQTTGAGATSLLPDFQFVPKRSSVTFPFIPDPNAGDIRVSLGPAFIGLSLQTDPQEFLNPGRGKIFNATVVNEGIEADEAKLEILYDQPNWRVDVLPGIRYNLPPGDNARFSLLVRAPADAKEGDQLHILVNATSHKDPNVRSQIRLTAIVTTGIDIPDETRHFKTDEESAQKVVRPPSKNTPGPTAVLGALAILGFGAWSRRRRGDA
jgi:MYXO-CTERM domain-containing protein